MINKTTVLGIKNSWPSTPPPKNFKYAPGTSYFMAKGLKSDFEITLIYSVFWLYYFYTVGNMNSFSSGVDKTNCKPCAN